MTMPDKNWYVHDDGTALIVGRYDLPGIAIEPSINKEARIALGGEEAFFNIFDLLEAVIHQAYATDEKQAAQILGEAILGSHG